MAAWKEAARVFHESYDRLAFPGGIAREFELLKAGEPTAIEMAVCFLEADPWYFRSGYHKADFLRLLRKHPLSDDQCARLRDVILKPCTWPVCSRATLLLPIRSEGHKRGF